MLEDRERSAGRGNVSPLNGCMQRMIKGDADSCRNAPRPGCSNPNSDGNVRGYRNESKRSGLKRARELSHGGRDTYAHNPILHFSYWYSFWDKYRDLFSKEDQIRDYGKLS